jgi:hypothetical protein
MKHHQRQTRLASVQSAEKIAPALKGTTNSNNEAPTPTSHLMISSITPSAIERSFVVIHLSIQHSNFSCSFAAASTLNLLFSILSVISTFLPVWQRTHLVGRRLPIFSSTLAVLRREVFAYELKSLKSWENSQCWTIHAQRHERPFASIHRLSWCGTRKETTLQFRKLHNFWVGIVFVAFFFFKSVILSRVATLVVLLIRSRPAINRKCLTPSRTSRLDIAHYISTRNVIFLFHQTLCNFF